MIFKNKQRIAKLAASSIIFAVFFLETYTAILHRACNPSKLAFCNMTKDPGLYPFLNYAMYKEAHLEGDFVNRYTLIATFENGTEKPLEADDFALPLYEFNTGAIIAISQNDQPKIQQYIKSYRQAGSPPFKTLRLDNHPLLITSKGVIEGSPAVINNISANSISTEPTSIKSTKE